MLIQILPAMTDESRKDEATSGFWFGKCPGHYQMRAGDRIEIPKRPHLKVLRPPVRGGIVKMPAAFPPIFSLEFCKKKKKNAKKIEWYLRIEGEGYRRLETYFYYRFQFHATNPHNAIFQLYTRICLWIWHDLNGSVKGWIFHLLMFFHICPWIRITIQYCKFNLDRVWCQFLWKELLHVTDT